MIITFVDSTYYAYYVYLADYLYYALYYALPYIALYYAYYLHYAHNFCFAYYVLLVACVAFSPFLRAKATIAIALASSMNWGGS